MQTLLVRKDVMSMESSLEVRVPFCDYRIVEYAYNMPWNIKSYNNREKGILRKAFENELPEIITWRKKSPYPKTFNPEYLDCVREMTSAVLSDKNSPLCEMLDLSAVSNLIQNPESLTEESHSAGNAQLLEYPNYTKPPVWRGREVPDVLLSGNHGLVATWRREQAEARTRERRPDLATP